MCDDRQPYGVILEGFRVGGAPNATAVLLARVRGDVGSFRPRTPGVELEDGSAELRVVLAVLNYSPVGRTLPRNDPLFTVSRAVCFG